MQISGEIRECEANCLYLLHFCRNFYQKGRTMKKYFPYLLLLLGLSAAPSLQAQKLLYYVDICTFQDQEAKPYLEFYLDISAASLDFVSAPGGGYAGKVEVDLAIVPRGSEEKVYERKFELLSGTIQDTTPSQLNFGIMDLRRISLEPDSYIFTGYLRDLNNPGGKQHMFVREFEIMPGKQEIASLSDISFIQSFQPSTETSAASKHGYDIFPLVTNSNFIDANEAMFYVEAYNVDKEAEEAFFVNCYLSQANASDPLSGYKKIMRMTPAKLNLITSSFDISALPSQTYYLNIEIFNQKQEMIANGSKKFFLSNSRVGAPVAEEANLPYTDHFTLNEEELDYYIHTLYYISTSTEREFAQALKTLRDKQIYFVNFWYKRRESQADSPAKPWIAYKSRVDHANQQFKAAHLEGWRTSRGRVLLTYGAPNDVEMVPGNNSTHPYIIWSYNKLVTQANVRFIFINLNEATNDYELIHSNRLGEPNNPRWQYDVVRNVFDGNLDNNNINDNW